MQSQLTGKSLPEDHSKNLYLKLVNVLHKTASIMYILDCNDEFACMAAYQGRSEFIALKQCGNLHGASVVFGGIERETRLMRKFYTLVTDMGSTCIYKINDNVRPTGNSIISKQFTEI